MSPLCGQGTVTQGLSGCARWALSHRPPLRVHAGEAMRDIAAAGLGLWPHVHPLTRSSLGTHRRRRRTGNSGFTGQPDR
ncbi:hypothetical protein AERO9AM_20725 [Aeromicrobium sp. 9AM]|nr:hypothetical protein AERO9AM_20725 [Aeromicrobium sp. 9AM]